jgi:hypothetical protein
MVVVVAYILLLRLATDLYLSKDCDTFTDSKLCHDRVCDGLTDVS